MNLKLGFNNLLIKDFKTYYLLNNGSGGIGVGTIHVPIRVMMETYGKQAMLQDIQELIKERSLSYYGFLTNCRD